MAGHHKFEFTTIDITATEHPLGRSSIEGNTEIKQLHGLLPAVINIQGKIEIDKMIGRTNQTPTEISMQDWFSSIKASTSQSIIKQQQHRSKPRIQRVPHLLKSIESNVKCFEPLIIALGPIHRGNSHLQQMEPLKARFMCKFAMGCDIASYQDLYDKAASVLSKAKDCYEASVLEGLTDMSFCQMMCLDGCFILQFLLMLTSEDPRNKIMKINDISPVRRDLFLLENQIPFVVLQALMSLRTYTDDLRELLIKFQDMQPSPRDTMQYSKLTSEDCCQTYESSVKEEPIHLLDLARTLSLNLDSKREKASSEWSSYRSVKELKAAGIRFCMATKKEFSEVTFTDNWRCPGTLHLPPLAVYYYTKSKLLNMAAYEACPDAPSDLAVTSYICFMDELVDQADDVKILRSEGLLFNQIGSDQLVAEIFNEISNGLVPNPDIYCKVRCQIEDHYKKEVYVWVAHWIHKYLYTPWAAFGLLAAFIIIMLTATQTWFSVFPRHK